MVSQLRSEIASARKESSEARRMLLERESQARMTQLKIETLQKMLQDRQEEVSLKNICLVWHLMMWILLKISVLWKETLACINMWINCNKKAKWIQQTIFKYIEQGDIV